MGVAKAHKARAFRMFDVIPFKPDSAELIWLSTRWAHGDVIL
jgi:hypothetical protein